MTKKNMYPFILMLLLAAAAGYSGEIRSELTRKRVIHKYISPSRWYHNRCEVDNDPVVPLTDEEKETLKKGGSKTVANQIFDSFIDRALKTYSEKYELPADLVSFLEANKEVRDIFIPALNYRYDDIKESARIFNELRKGDEELLKKYAHLATAISVVYDHPDAVTGSRYSCIWGMKAEQFPEVPGWKDVWDFYTAPKNARYFAFRLDKLSWPVLIHLVDNDISSAEREWILKKYKRNCVIKDLYQKVQYDYTKLSSRTAGKIGSKPYTMENLLSCGGVCGDQAHYTTRVAKTLGVPAMKVSGTGRYGGMGHAWAGFLVINRGKRLLDFTGRYFYDYYYTGDIFDPQTLTFTLDRFVAMMYDGASLSYPKYNQSMVLTRIAEAVLEESPTESLILTGKALEQNYFNMWAWPLLMEHIKKGTADKKKGIKYFNEMIKMLKQHPDMTYPCLSVFLQCFEKKQKQAIFEQTFKLYKSRPDLQLLLRMAQAKHLVDNGEKIIAINKLVPTIVQHSKEGTLVLPAMQLAVEIAKEFKVEKQAYKLLVKADAYFPKKRGNTPSKSYAEFKELLNSLK